MTEAIGSVDWYLLKLETRIKNLELFVISTKCHCSYYGDGDYETCRRCSLLGSTDGPWKPEKRGKKLTPSQAAEIDSGGMDHLR